MSDKERISATVDPEVKEYLDQQDINTSGLINKLIKQHMGAGDSTRGILELRRDQIEAEIQSLNTRVDHKEAELEKVDSRLGDLDEQQESRLEDARDALEGKYLTVDDKPVQFWADELDMDPLELIAEIEG